MADVQQAQQTFNETQQKAAAIASAAISAKQQAEAAAKKARELQNRAKDAAEKAKKAREQAKKELENVKKRKDEAKQKAKDAINDSKSFLKGQVGQNATQQIQTILTPILLQFIRSINIADVLMKKLINDTKKQVQNKGVLDVSGGTFTFTPSPNTTNYQVYKQNFDRKIGNIKKAVNALNTVITTLRNALRILNAALAAYQIYTKIRLFLLNAKLVKLSIELAAPSPGGVKPTAGITLTQIVKDIQNIKIAQEKAKEYQLGVNAASQFLNIFVRSINKIKVKLDQLKFIIIDPTTNPSSGINANNDLTNQIDGASTTAPSEDTYINVLGKSYILKLVTLPNNYRQYQALDSFSKMKITQTAPSKIKTNDELFEEIKQILG
jgi:predicted Holliday junction resolvase-like endonuclease